MKKINFRQPKYVIPALIMPFLFFAYYLMGQFGVSSKSGQQITVRDSLQRQEGFNADMPGVGKKIEDENIKNKFDAYRDAYKKADQYSPLTGIDPNEKGNAEEDVIRYSPEDVAAFKAKRTLDSLNKVLGDQHNNLDKQMNAIRTSRPVATSGYANEYRSSKKETEHEKAFLEELKKIGKLDNERKNEIVKNEADPYEQQMKMFREQMQLVDSMQNAGSKKEEFSNSKKERDRAKRNFNPKEDTSFKPMPVSVNPSFIKPTFNTIKSFSKSEVIEAIIDQDEKATAGKRIRIRLLQDIYVGGKLIPKSTYLYAIVTGFQTSRINLSISQIFYNNETLPVNLDVFDNDGYLGLYVPGSTFREFTKEIGTQGTNGLSSIQTSDDSNPINGILSQLFRTSTTAAANLIKKEKAFVKYNYIVYLKENKK